MASDKQLPTIRFVNGFAAGFKVPVPERFANALDNKELAKGDVLYQSSLAYDGRAWRDILSENEWFIQIRETMTGGETVFFDVYHRTPDRTAFLPVSSKLNWDDFLNRLRTADFKKSVEDGGKACLAAKTYFLEKHSSIDQNGQPPSGINYKYRLGREMDELLGVCKGVLSDGVVLEREAAYLHEWLRRNPEIAAHWPARELAARLARILWDGTVSSEEAEELKLFLAEMTGETEKRQTFLASIGIQANPSSTLPLDQPAPDIIFIKRDFCFTGKFLSGTRNRCQQQVEYRGGKASDSAISCHYLVIGNLGSRDWAHSSHGRKIEAAIARKAKQDCAGWPKIVCEEHWVGFLA